MKKIKIPTQLFITVKRVEQDNDVPYRFGFLNSYEPHKSAFENKKKTQMDWAYGGCRLWQRYEDRCGVIWQSHPRVVNGLYARETDLVQVPDDLQPIILDNDPRSGFKILRSVSRYTTSNKVWRVLDPIGIEFEITTGCFEDIVMNSTIINGEIQGECIWVSNKKLVIYNEAK